MQWSKHITGNDSLFPVLRSEYPAYDFDSIDATRELFQEAEIIQVFTRMKFAIRIRGA